jgi:hypothetical protein
MTPGKGCSERHVGMAVALAALLLLGMVPLEAERLELKSPGLVGQLVQVMSERRLNAIAVQHPSEPDRYVAARLFPGVQLLVITARSSAKDYIQSQLTPTGYANVYSALQHGTPESKLFIQDMGSDGLRGLDGGTADIVYVRGKDQHVLNGDHKAADMSRNDYAKLVGDLDRQYAELLSLLVRAARATGHQRAPR